MKRKRGVIIFLATVALLSVIRFYSIRRIRNEGRESNNTEKRVNQGMNAATAHKHLNVTGEEWMKTTDHASVIQQIAILGERNSGTTWMWNHLVDCFNHTIKVT